MIDYLPYVLPAFVSSLALEIGVWRWTGKGHFEWRDTTASLLLGVGETIVRGLGGGAVIYLIYALMDRMIPWSLPTGLAWGLLCFLLCDFFYYWSHRLSHECRWLWASHVVHHSSQYFNLSTALRSSWTDVLSLSFLFWVPVIMLGFSAELVFTIRALALLYGFWLHVNALTNLGPLEHILVTPQHHKIHHARNPCYLDKNYGGILIFWDKLFGTFIAERKDQPPAFGIVHGVATFNPFVLALHEWIAIARDLRRARSLRELAQYLFGKPGWRADGQHQTSAAVRQQWEAAQSRPEPAE